MFVAVSKSFCTGLVFSNVLYVIRDAHASGRLSNGALVSHRLKAVLVLLLLLLLLLLLSPPPVVPIHRKSPTCRPL
jgi:hypothetical protein